MTEAEDLERKLLAASKALTKAKEVEKQMLSNGYRYVKVGNNTEVLVKCNSKGEPTIKEKKYLEKLSSTIPK